MLWSHIQCAMVQAQNVESVLRTAHCLVMPALIEAAEQYIIQCVVQKAPVEVPTCLLAPALAAMQAGSCWAAGLLHRLGKTGLLHRWAVGCGQTQLIRSFVVSRDILHELSRADGCCSL